jgi:hypothetical protein
MRKRFHVYNVLLKYEICITTQASICMAISLLADIKITPLEEHLHSLPLNRKITSFEICNTEKLNNYLLRNRYLKTKDVAS